MKTETTGDEKRATGMKTTKAGKRAAPATCDAGDGG